MSAAAGIALVDARLDALALHLDTDERRFEESWTAVRDTVEVSRHHTILNVPYARAWFAAAAVACLSFALAWNGSSRLAVSMVAAAAAVLATSRLALRVRADEFRVERIAHELELALSSRQLLEQEIELARSQAQMLLRDDELLRQVVDDVRGELEIVREERILLGRPRRATALGAPALERALFSYRRALLERSHDPSTLLSPRAQRINHYILTVIRARLSDLTIPQVETEETAGAAALARRLVGLSDEERLVLRWAATGARSSELAEAIALLGTDRRSHWMDVLEEFLREERR